MKTLILNGSPRKNGDTSALTELLKQSLKGEVIELYAYHDNLKPCLDCRACRKLKGCAIKDDMQKVLDETLDNIVIASPVYAGNLTAPMIGIQSRFNFLYANKRFANILHERKKKTGAIILVGGGDKNPNVQDVFLLTAKDILRKLKANLPEQNIITSFNTDLLPAINDKAAVQKIKELADNLNSMA